MRSINFRALGLIFPAFILMADLAVAKPPAVPTCAPRSARGGVGSCSFEPNNKSTSEIRAELYKILDNLHDGHLFSEGSAFNMDNTRIDLVSGLNPRLTYYTEVDDCIGDNDETIHCMEFLTDYVTKIDVRTPVNLQPAFVLHFTLFSVLEQKTSEAGISFFSGLLGAQTADPTLAGLGLGSAFVFSAGVSGSSELLVNLTLGRWADAVRHVGSRKIVVRQDEFRYDSALEESEIFGQGTYNAIETASKTTYSGQLAYDKTLDKVIIRNFSFRYAIEEDLKVITSSDKSGILKTDELKESQLIRPVRYIIGSESALELELDRPKDVLTITNVRKKNEKGYGLLNYSRTKGTTKESLVMLVTAKLDPASSQWNETVDLGKNATGQGFLATADNPLCKSSNFVVGELQRCPLPPGSGQGLETVLADPKIITLSPRLRFAAGGDTDVVLATYLLKIDPLRLDQDSWDKSVHLKVWSDDGKIMASEKIPTLTLSKLAKSGYSFGVQPKKGKKISAKDLEFKVSISLSEKYGRLDGRTYGEYSVTHEADSIESDPEDVPFRVIWHSEKVQP